MSSNPIDEIKDIICIISIFQERENTFRKELDFFNKQMKDGVCLSLNLIGAFKRLDHEVMFLCIEVFGFYEAIEKKKSLYIKIIKNHGAELSQVAKPPYDVDRYKFLGVFSSNCKRDYTDEEKKEIVKFFDDRGFQSRQELQNSQGINSSAHIDLDKWAKDSLYIEEHLKTKLGEYRDLFAHRLNELEKMKIELSCSTVEDIQERLDIIHLILEKYKTSLTKIINHTTAQLFDGRFGFVYDSLSRLDFYDKHKQKIDKEFYSQD